MSFSGTYRGLLSEALESIDLAAVEQAIQWLDEARVNRRNVFVCGNGGSASTASHLACDLNKGASYGRGLRFRVIPLTDSVATLTAYSNDVGYEAVFVEQFKNFAQPGDLLVAISGSGNSPNVLRVAEHARELGCRSVGLTGRDGGGLAKLVDLNLHVACPHMGRIEDGHFVICHMLAYYFMEMNGASECAD